MGAQRYTFGPYEFDSLTGSLRKHAIRIRLQRKPQQILLALLERPGETVTRQELRLRLWPEDTFVDFDQGLNVGIKKLRDALCDSSDSPTYILTESGVGYRFIGTLEMPPPTSEPPDRGASTDILVPQPSPGLPSTAEGSRLNWIRAIAITWAALLTGALLTLLPRWPVPARPLQAVITLPPNLRLVTSGENAALALSPDGGTVVFSAVGASGRSMLWLRRLESLIPTPIPGTESGGFPFWSPDGKKLAFFTDLELRQVDLSSGSITRICTAKSGRGGAWAIDGTILFAQSTRTPIYKIDANGGEAVPVTHLDDKRFTTHRWPSLLPDGKHFVFLAANHEEPTRPAAIFLGSLDGSPERFLAEADTNAIAVRGALLFVSGGRLVSRKLNEFTWHLESEERVLAEAVDFDPGLWLSSIAVSRDSLLYRKRSENSQHQTIAWFDRHGNWLANVGPPGTYRGLALAPSGQEIAVLCGDPDTNICLLHPDSSVTQITNSPLIGALAWAPDSSSIAYYRHRPNEDVEALIKSLTLSEPEKRLPVSSDTSPVSFHPDGRRLLLVRWNRQATNADLLVLDLSTGNKMEYLSNIPTLLTAQFSPDGKWLAYSSREAGIERVYVASFPSPSTRYQISASGVAPRWRGDSGELYFLRSDETLMAVSVSSEHHGVLLGTPQPLFRPAIFPAPWDRVSYDVNPDGSKFVINTVANSSNSELVILTNWIR